LDTVELAWFHKHKSLLYRLLLYLLVAALIYLRITVFLHPNSLMIDEANVALNLAERNFIELWQPLDYQQYAPPLFLSWAKLSSWLFGMNEYALRLPALLSSLLSIYLIIRICRLPYLRLSAPFILIALCLFGSSHIMLFHADLLKQYSSDGLFSLLLVALAMRYSYSTLLLRKGLFLWTILGSILIWFSMPIVFVLASVGLFYIYEASRNAQGNKVLKALAVPAAIWGVQFVVYFFAILKTDAESEYLQNFHRAYFFDYALWNAESWVKNTQIIMGLVQAFVGKTVVVFIWLAFSTAAALYTIARKHRALFFLLVLPFFFAVVASFLHYYSFIPRLLVFFMPLFSILLALGLKTLWQIQNVIARFLVLLSSIFIIAQMSAWKYILPDTHCLMEETREVMDDLRPVSDPSQAIFVNHSGVPALTFYTKYHSNSENYRYFAHFRHINWDQNLVKEVNEFMDEHPQTDLMVIWGHERNAVIQKQLNSLEEASFFIMQDIEKTMARGILLAHSKGK